MNPSNRRVALGRQLRHCPCIQTLGVKPNPRDYSTDEIALIRNAEKIYFPTFLYAEAMDVMGKRTFPSISTYRHLGDKIKQTHLFILLGVPMPKTRIYYGDRQKERIRDDFEFPVVGKLPRGYSKGDGVFLLRTAEDLQGYLDLTNVAYIQQYVPLEKDLRVVVLGNRIVHAYWRVASSGEFRTNVAKGGRIVTDGVPEEALSLALDTALRCGFDHVGMDICHDGRDFLIMEANMVFGLEGFRTAGKDFRIILKNMVEANEI